MSKEIVELCLDWSEDYEYPLMIIASRNQVDAASGYAFTSNSLAHLVHNHVSYDKNRVLLCRDHCGPYFSDGDKGLSLDSAVERCKQTISADIGAGYDLIHIDVSRVPEQHQEVVTHELFEYATALSDRVVFEYGSEDNSIENLDNATDALQRQISTVERYKHRIVFMVSRTGSLTKQRQVGSFDVSVNSKLARTIHSNGMLFKEHNADYLVMDEVRLRLHAGVDAINIAPQLGCAQSAVLWDMANELPQFREFLDCVLSTQYWVRWCTPDVTDEKTKFISSAHYCFDTQEYRKVVAQLPAEKFHMTLRHAIHTILNEYRLGYTQ